MNAGPRGVADTLRIGRAAPFATPIEPQILRTADQIYASAGCLSRCGGKPTLPVNARFLRGNLRRVRTVVIPVGPAENCSHPLNPGLSPGYRLGAHLPQRNVFEISMLPQVNEREPDPKRISGDSQRARYCTAHPEEVRNSTPAHTSPSVLFRSLHP
jgi:hypothetical protein